MHAGGEMTVGPGGGITMRRYLQFGLKTILWLTVVVAVAVSWWRQRSLRAEIDATREQMRKLEADVNLRDCVGQVCMAADPKNPRHIEALKALQDARWLFYVDRQRINGCDVIVFEEWLIGNFTGLWYSGTTAAFLLKGHELADVFVDNTHRVDQVGFRDFDQDGENDLVFQIGGGAGAVGGSTRAFTIAGDRFLEITKVADPLEAVPPVDEHLSRR
jgi:hypothetical protein